MNTQAPVKAPVIDPATVPQRRMHPGTVCKPQREQMPGRIRRAFE